MNASGFNSKDFLLNQATSENSQLPKGISVIISAYNEEENIANAITELNLVLKTIPLHSEIIVIDDGSTDSTLAIIKKLSSAQPNLRAVSFQRNTGQSAAFDAGFRLASYSIIATMDADLQNDPHDLPKLIDKLSEGFDVVAGWRKNRQDQFFSRRLPSVIANWIIRKITKTKVNDLGCSLRVYEEKITRNLHLYGEMHRFICPLAENLGAKIAELEVNHRPRTAGKSKYGITRTLKVILDLCNVWYLQNYLTKPIYVFGGIGLGSSIIGTLLALYTLFEKFAFGYFVHRNPLFLIAIMLIILSFQFISVGLIAETVMRTYFESQNKRPYILRETIGFKT